MKKYKLFINEYNPTINDYIVNEKIVKTEDIYHEIGFIYCNSITDIKRIDYKEIEVGNMEFEIEEKLKEEYFDIKINVHFVDFRIYDILIEVQNVSFKITYKYDVSLTLNSNIDIIKEKINKDIIKRYSRG